MVDLINSVETRYSVTGLEDSLSRIQRIQAAEQRLAAQSASLSSATAGLDRSTLSASRALDSFTRSMDPLSRAQAQLERGLNLTNRAMAQGVPLTQENTRALANARARVDELSHAVTGHTSATGLNRMQMLESVHVLKSLADETIATGNPLRALALEGGRITEIFSMGGVGGALISAKAALAGVVSPLGVASAGMLAVGAAAVYAEERWNSAQESLRRSTLGLGRQTGTDVGGLERSAELGASAGGLSVSQGQRLAAQYNSTGALGPDVMTKLIGSTRNYAALAGSTVPEAGAKLAQAFADPAKGAIELDKELGFLDDRTRKLIETQAAQLDRSGAQLTFFQAYSRSVDGAAASTGLWGERLNIVGNLLSNVGSYIGQRMALGSQTDIATSNDADGLRRLLNLPDVLGGRDVGAMRQRLAQLDKTSQAQRDDAVRRETSLKAGDIIGQVSPDAGRYQNLVNQQKVLQDALANDSVRNSMGSGLDSTGKLASGAGLLADTLGKVNDQLANFMSASERQTLSINASVMSINAWTLGEKLAAATAQEMASLGIRQIKTADELLAVQSKQAEIIAQANSKADDIARTASNNLALAGLTGLDRQRAEINQKYSDYRDQLTDLSGGSDLQGIGSPFMRGSTAVSGFANAVDGATKRINDLLAGGVPAGRLPGQGVSVAGGATLGGFDAGTASGMATPAMIAYAASRTGMPAALIDAIGKVENGGRLSGGTTLLGSDGRPSTAWGYGQLTNGAAADVAKAIPGFNKYDPSTAVLGSAEYLRIQLDRHHGDMTGALKGYGGTSDYAAKVAAISNSGSALGVSLDTLPKINAANRQDLDAANLAAGTGILGSASNSLNQRADAFDMLTKSVGMTNIELARYNEIMTLQNQLDRAKVQITPDMRAEIGRLGDQASSLAAKQDMLTRQTDALDSVRSFATNSGDSIFTALAHHQPLNKTIDTIGTNLGDSLIKSGIGSITNSIFGKSGSSGGGLAGGFLGDLFGGIGGGFTSWMPHFADGTHDAPGGLSLVGERGPEIVRLPQHAQVVPNGRGIGGAPGHTFNFGDVHIHPVGGAQFTPDQVQAIRGQVLQGNQDTMQQITRNLGQIQADAQQFG